MSDFFEKLAKLQRGASLAIAAATLVNKGSVKVGKMKESVDAGKCPRCGLKPRATGTPMGLCRGCFERSLVEVSRLVGPPEDPEEGS